MTHLIESEAPAAFDLRSWITRFEEEARRSVGEKIRIDIDLPEGPAYVAADPRELDELFSNLVVNVGIVMQPCGRLTVHLEADEDETLPDEEDLIDRSRYLHLAIEDRGCVTVEGLFRRLLEPLINAAPQMASRTGALRWGGKILFEENDDESRVIHLLLPYAAEKAAGH